MKKIILTLAILSSIAFASTTIATVNGIKITDDIVPAYTKLDDAKKKVVKEQLINEFLLMDYALKDKSITGDKKFKEIVKNQISAVEKAYKAKTKKDLTDEQKKNIKGSIAMKFLMAKKARNMKVSDKEAKEFFNKNKEKFKFPDSVEIASIATKDKKEADKILKQIKKSKDKPAKLMSIAKKMGQRGYLGWLPKNAFPEDVFKKIYSMKPNTVVKKPIKVQDTYNITYLINKKKAGLAKFSEVKDNLKMMLKQQKVAKWAEKKVNELRTKATIK